jgi:hypothetical protein
MSGAEVSIETERNTNNIQRVIKRLKLKDITPESQIAISLSEVVEDPQKGSLPNETI